MSFLTAEQILSADDMKLEVVTCSEWGGDVLVRPLPSYEQDQWEISCAEAKEDGKAMPDQFRARFALLGLCNPDGSPLFKPEQLKALSRKNGAPVNRIVRKIREISGMTEQAVEQAEKNSDAAPDDNSGSNSATDSPSPT